MPNLLDKANACRALAIVALLTGCATSLPSRPPTGNHGQGGSPAADCPGQYRIMIDLPDGGEIFDGCWGTKTAPQDQSPTP